jgi:hypothetical protein
MLSGFQWYRRLCGGRWAKVAGYFWGKRWVRVGRASRYCDEDWG